MRRGRSNLALLRSIVGVVAAVFPVTGFLLTPASLASILPLGSVNPLLVQTEKQPPPIEQRSVSLVAPAPAAATPAAPAIVDDAVILLDVTGSMRGEGPDPRVRDIWDKTLNAVLDIVDRLSPQTNLAVVPFSNGPNWASISPGPVARGANVTPRQLSADSSREEFKAQLKKLVANGEATWVYESLEYSLSQLRQWREADPGQTHRQALFLYTDGIDNGPHEKLGIDGIVQLLKDQKADSRSLYFVYNDLGSYLSPEQKATLAANGVTVTSGPPTSNVELVTEKLDFGELSVSSSGASQSVSFRSGFGDVWGKPVRLRIEGVGATLPLTLTAGTVQLSEQLMIVPSLTAPLTAGQYQARLIIESVDSSFNLIPRNSIDLTFSAAPLPTATAIPQPTPTAVPTPLPRSSIIEGVPDPLLFLAILVLVVVGVFVTLWQLEVWMFKRPRPMAQVLWKPGEEPRKPGDEGVRVRTMQPDRSRSAQQWIIGIESYISLPENDPAIKARHAKIVYGGRKERIFRLFPVEGQVWAQNGNISPGGMALVDGSTFVIASYHFRFESLDEKDWRLRADLARLSR